ncbi:DUF6912 family protein [Corynebacterium mendelii]|uniref:Uncharacterized protein n=1 Tax=Corynebacterium mendelii TaxID=2765362 RepID=A0A939IU23_9CORY|nr:hypothetical protein [Corynebacterium mendelii]MBN9644464.1 hypothetical protein [Corynebacterium mendelii]
MRVYLPATFASLKELSDTGEMVVQQGWGFAVTPALEEFYTVGDEEEIAHVAFQEAARASLRLLSLGTEHFPHRRVVVTVDVDDKQVTPTPENGEAVVSLDPQRISFADLAALHVDIGANEEATAQGVEAVHDADLGDEDAELTVGDALDNFLAWYDPTELNVLVALM